MTAEYPEKKTDEKKEQEKKKEKPKENNWGAFLGHLVVIFIIVFFTGLLGANLVFFTRISNLDKMFPDDENKPPYSPSTSQSGGKNMDSRKMKGGNGDNGCGTPITFTQDALLEHGMPYTSNNWLTNKIKYSFIGLRKFLKIIIRQVATLCKVMPKNSSSENSANSIISFIFGPIIIGLTIVSSALWWIPTLVSTFTKDDTENGILISIAGLFLGWTWIVPIILSAIQVIGVIITFVGLPFFSDKSVIQEIFGNVYS